MNKLTKYGLSALCGSLAAISSASAGDLAVSGGATVTYSSNNGETTGNPIGMASAVGFKGTGELDNGWGVSLAIDNDDKSAFSVGSIALDMQSLGELKFSLGTGAVGLDSFDDKMPAAWEETWGTSLGTSVNLITGVGSSTSIQWKAPTVASSTLAIAYAAVNDGQQTSDKAQGGSSDGRTGTGVDVTLSINPSTEYGSAELFVGGSRTDLDHSSNTASGTNADNEGDREEVTAGLILSVGPISAGYQKSGEWTGLTQTGTDVDYYNNTHWSLAFNVNDDLSISYGELESRKGFTNPADSEEVKLNVESLQVAYSIGGASFKIAQTDGSNLAYSTAAYGDREATTVALSLAF